MNIKQPAVYDVSHYKTINNFSAINPRPALMITKATECYPGAPFNNTTDPKFVEYFAGMKSAAIPRGTYHFFRKNYDALKQAQHFANTVRSHITNADVLILDVEEGGEKASQLWAWFNHVRAVFPNNLCMIYSRKNILDAIPMTESEKAYFKQIPIWTAGYPYFPDLYNTVPAGYIPDQTKYGPVWLWQYTASGVVTGISGAVDLNWIDPVFYEMIKNLDDTPTLPPPPPTDIATYPFRGVKQIHTERYGRKIYVNVIDPKLVEIQVFDEDNFPSANCRKYGAQIAWNGDDWDRTTRLPKNNPSPSLMVFADGHIAIGNYLTTQGESYYSSGLRYLVQNGINVIPANGTEAKYLERHARSLTGMGANGSLIHITVDGDYPDKGLTLYECAQLMIEYGAVTAFDQGGGGDSVEVLNGQVVNQPDDNVGDLRYERKVPQTILVYADKENDMLEGTAKEKLGKTVTIRTSPRVATGNSTAKRISPFTTISFVGVVDDQDHPGDPNYKWFDLGDGEYANYIYPPNGVRFDIITQPTPDPDPDPVPDPVPELPVSCVMTFANGAKAEYVFVRIIE